MVLVKRIPERPSVRFSLVSAELMPARLLGLVRQTFLAEFGEFTESRPTVPGLDCFSVLAKSRYVNPAPGDSAKDELARFSQALERLRSVLSAAAEDAGADWALTTGALAEFGPRMIVTDVDSTFITTEVIEMLAAAAGTEELVRSITDRAMRGELDFAQSLAERVATLRGVPDSIFADVASQVRLTPGAADVVRVIHEHSGTFGLVSGGFHEVVDAVAEPLGIEAILANRLETADGVLTGRTEGPVVDKAAKAEAVRRWARLRGYDLSQVVVAGDGANDLAMMEIVGLSIAFCAKPVVAAKADASLAIPRLDALLALVGWDAA